MNTKIIKQEKNPFLQREEITLEIKNPNTPNEDEVKTAIGKDPSLTVIKKINTSFGTQTFTAEVVVYDNKEAMKKIETIPKKIRKKIKADEKAAKEAEAKAQAEAEAKPEEPSPETPTEEPKKEPEEKPKQEKNQNE